MTLPAIRVLVTGDHALMRTALARLIEGELGMEIAADCANLPDALAEAILTPHDIVVTDLDGDVHSETFGSFFAIARPRPVLVLTAHDDSQALTTALGYGALGVVLKNRPAEVLMRAIRAVVAGDAWIEPSVLSRMAGVAPQTSDTESVKLTRREREIVELVGQGLKNKKIGERLFITDTTVRHHLTSIFNKLAVTSRLELMHYAYRGNLTGTFVPGPRR